MSERDLPAFPDHKPYRFDENGVMFVDAGSPRWAPVHYERALKEAYAARLRVAVEALRKLSAHHDCPDPHYSCAKLGFNSLGDEPCDCHALHAIDALSAIGEVPDV